MLCSKLHCQKGFDLIFFLFKIGVWGHRGVVFVERVVAHRAPMPLRHSSRLKNDCLAEMWSGAEEGSH